MNTSRALFLIVLLLSADLTMAQGSTREVLPYSSDAFVLTPAAPEVSREIIIDSVKRADITLTALSQELDVMLISPERVRYAIGQARPDFKSWITLVEGGGANYRAILENPQPGTWTIQVRARKLTADIDALLNVLLDSDLFMAMTAGDVEHRVGQTAAVTLAAFDGVTRLTNFQINASALAPNGISSVVSFRDDGLGFDVSPNDGIFTAAVDLPVHGEYVLRATATGKSAGEAFLRTASISLRANKARASLTGTFIDRGIDGDGNGLFESIVVAPAIAVHEAGSYRVDVRLRSASGRVLQKSVVEDLTTGAANPPVAFDAESMRVLLGEDGPYEVAAVLVERVENGEHVFVDRHEEIGQTTEYRLQQLQRRDRTRIGTAQFTGVDASADGRYEKLRVDVNVDADIASSYSIFARLDDSNQDVVTQVDLERSLSVGTNVITFEYEGSDIGKRGVDGPYQMHVSIHGPTAASHAGAWLETPPFKAAQFVSAVPDSVPPQLMVVVTPAVLWPVDHRMVEIIPEIHVSDDKDPSPTVKLVSVTSSEGSNQLGDGNTSPDILIENGRIFLRAERSALNQHREYVLTWEATDKSGNSARSSAKVFVPQSSAQ